MKIEQGHVYKAHNKSALLYHLVCPVRYRRKAITKEVEKTGIATCIEISRRYEIHFTEIGTDRDHIHFLIQSVPMLSPKQIVQTVKSIIAREVFSHNPDVKKMLWGGISFGLVVLLHQYGRALWWKDHDTKLRQTTRKWYVYANPYKYPPTFFIHITLLQRDRIPRQLAARSFILSNTIFG